MAVYGDATYGDPVTFANPDGGGGKTGTATQQQKGAKATLAATLDAFGLGNLADWAWKKYLNGENVNQIMLDLRQTKAYKTRFPAMAALAKEGRALSEAQYIDLERSYAAQFSAYGIPKRMFDDPEDFARLISGDVSSSELGSRLALYSQAALGIDQATRARLKADYGWHLGHLTAFLINPAKSLPKLEQQFLAAQIGGAADRTGFGLGKGNANYLARLGITPDKAAEGFAGLAGEADLFAPLPGTAEDQITRREQLDATFAGNAETQQAIKRRQQGRSAAFSGSSQFASSKEGFAGVGEAQGA